MDGMHRALTEDLFPGSVLDRSRWIAGRQIARAWTALALVVLVPACGGSEMAAPPPPGEPAAFGAPERVAILGYAGEAMEPFVTKDGLFLLFNSRNDPAIDTKLHYAERVDGRTFQYRGELAGVNTPSLEGVPSLDAAGNLFFVSTRRYDQTLSTLYRGRLAGGTVTGVELVPGVSARTPGLVQFDAEVSDDGNTLFVVEGQFTGGGGPRTTNIGIAVRDGSGFRRPAMTLMSAINTAALEYAPAISADLLELFFTRLDNSGAQPVTHIMRSVRASASAAFGPPQRLETITGFVEAPTLSGDGRTLYYHLLEGNRFVIQRVVR